MRLLKQDLSPKIETNHMTRATNKKGVKPQKLFAMTSFETV